MAISLLLFLALLPDRSPSYSWPSCSQADQGVITGTETTHPMAQKRLALEDAFAISIDADETVAIRGYACATRMASDRAHFEFDER